MRDRQWMLPMALIAALAAGCGRSSEPSGSTASSSTATASQTGPQSGDPASGESSQSLLSSQKDPVQAVTVFLDAVRRGDDDTAAAMFTETARQKATEMNIEVAPKGSDTARFQVGKVEYVDQDLAKVPSCWTDYDAEGQLRTDQMAWMLRRGPQGWRVAGMAATVFEGEPPLLLDFENPQETLRKLELLREEISRRSEASAHQAAQPANPADEIRR